MTLRLLDVVRTELKGTKEGCGEGECGACAVLVDGELTFSCLVPAMQCEGAKIETIESNDPLLTHLKNAFVEKNGSQCGICTPGMIMASLVLLRRNLSPTLEEVREALAGNICRCTGYGQIFEAVLHAAAQARL